MRFSIKISREQAAQAGKRIWRRLKMVPRFLFIRHSHYVDIIAVGLVMILAVYLLIVLLYIPPTGIEWKPPADQDFRVDVIDRVEFWIEEVDIEQHRELKIDGSIFNNS